MSERMLRRRSGWMLVELVMVMTLISLVMASGLALLVAVKHAHRTVVLDAVQARSLHRLARDFRHDLQRATSLELTNESTGLAIVASMGNRVEYAVSRLGIERTVRHTGGLVVRDLFRLPGKPQVTFSVSRADPVAAISSGTTAQIGLDLTASSRKLDSMRFEIMGRAPRVARPREDGDE